MYSAAETFPNDIVGELCRMVKTAAGPTERFDSEKSKMWRSCKNLGMHTEERLIRRHRGFWQREYTNPTHKIITDLRQRYADWKARREDAANEQRKALAADLVALAARLTEVDADFYGEAIEALREAAHASCGGEGHGGV